MISGIHSFRRPLVVLATVLIFASAVAAEPDLPPQRATVSVARAESIMTLEGPLNAEWLYPEGRIDYGVIEWLLQQAVAGSVGVDDVEDAWDILLSPSDRVGVMVDVTGIQPHDPLLEALIRQIMDRGIPMRNITIFAGEESALFRAGYDISGRTPGVRVMASDDQGYRNGLTRIVLNQCTKIVNLSRLRIDPEIGMYGALANCLAAVPYVDRDRLIHDPENLPEAAARATMKRKMVLHILDALSPGYRPRDGAGRYDTWAYNGVLASIDPVAVDTVAREILQAKLAEGVDVGECPQVDVPYLVPASEEYRLGVADLEQIDLVESGP